MTREEIISMAIQSGAEFYGSRSTGELLFGTLDFDVERFAALVAAAEREKWEPVLEAVLREIPNRERHDDGNAPGHCHEIPGIWDSDNGALAGKPCAWCAAWNTAKEAIRARGKK